MKPVTSLMRGLLCLALTLLSASAAAKPGASDLLGKWEGNVEFGKFKFQMILRIAQSDGGKKLAVTMDVPEHGAKSMPISALLFNSPDVRIEIDQFQTAYNGKLTEDLNEIRGEFEEGPGGRPIAVTFLRSTQADAPEPERVFTFKPGEAKDIRGYWKSTLEPVPGMSFTFGLSIGRIEDGSFKVALDVLEQGAKDIPASSVSTAGENVDIKWEALQMSFKGKLADDKDKLSGEWKMQGKPISTEFKRLQERASLMPANVSFQPDSNNANDLRGEWAGRLELPAQKLRLVLKLGQTPEGAFAGTLLSLDQGSGELPISSADVALPAVKLEWKALRAKFEGVLTNNGSVLDGTWEQVGNKMPLKLERKSGKDNSAATNAKS